MNARTTLLTITTLALGAAGAEASMITAPAPIGYHNNVSLSGGDGTPKHTDRWFNRLDGEAMSTNWSNKPITYQAILGETPQQYMLGVTAKNWTDLVLPPNYSKFKVNVNVNGDSMGQMRIDASDDVWRTSWIDIGEQAGLTEVTLKWTNDSYKAGHWDANIAIGAVQFAALIPAPGAGALMILGLGVAAPRRSRNE